MYENDLRIIILLIIIFYNISNASCVKDLRDILMPTFKAYA